MPTYRVKDGIDRVLPGIGRTVNGKITTNARIEHPLFELVRETPDTSNDTMTAPPSGEVMNTQPVANAPQATAVTAHPSASNPISSQPANKEISQ
jgi:hypothetical protein